MRSRGIYRGDSRDTVRQEIIVHRREIGTAALGEPQGGLNIQTQRVGALDDIDDLLRLFLDDFGMARQMVLDRVGAVDASGGGDIHQRHIGGQWRRPIFLLLQEPLVAVLEESHVDRRFRSFKAMQGKLGEGEGRREEGRYQGEKEMKQTSRGEATGPRLSEEEGKRIIG